jgi:hypothetical protein
MRNQKAKKYCSKECFSLASRTLKNEQRLCVVCGNSFEPKTKNQVCCFKACAVKLGAKTRAGIQDSVELCVDCGEHFIFHPMPNHPEEPRCKKCVKLRAKDRERARSAWRRGIVIVSRPEVINYLEVANRDNWTCQLCGLPVDATLSWPDSFSGSIDHVLPLCKGGKHVADNVQLTHLACNCRKKANETRTESQASIVKEIGWESRAPEIER